MTRYEEKCEKLAKKLGPMTQAQQEWIKRKLPAFKLAYRTAEYCSECGSRITNGRCSRCGEKFGDDATTRRAHHKKHEMKYYYGIETTAGGEQVHRHYIVCKTAEVGRPASYRWFECQRTWMNRKGHIAYQSIEVKLGLYIYDRWDEGTKIETRKRRPHTRQEERMRTSDWATYPRIKTTGWLRRLGFNGKQTRYDHLTWKQLLLNDPFCEWLCKKGHEDYLEGVSIGKLRENKREIELADKHGYKIEDIRMWTDMLEMYRKCGKDTLNAKYSRPESLKKGHDTAMRLDERRRAKEEEKRLLEQDKKYKEEKMAYLGLAITDGELTASVIQSAKEMVEEGRKMHHCVASYITEKDSVIFTIRNHEGERIATVEWSISEKRTVQCRGQFNCKPQKYDQILRLMRKGKREITKAERLSKKKKTA